MSTLNAPTVGSVTIRPAVYPAHMQATIKTGDGRHTLTALLGPNPAAITDGRGGWSEVARARKPSVIEWLGPNSHKATVELVLDAWASGGTVQTQMAVVDALCPVAPTVETPTVYVTGVVLIPATIPWVIQGVTWSDQVLRPDGRVARVTVAFDLLQWRQGDVVVRNSPGKAAAAKTGTAPSKLRTYTVRRGDTLSSIAAKQLGSASKWPALAAAQSPKLRDPNHLKVGQVLKLP